MAFSTVEIAQFWSRVSVHSQDRCWIWNGATPKGEHGYGRFNGEYAHRIAYRMSNGEIPEGMIVRHQCDNRRCVNPAHLLVGTAADNTGDAIQRNRLASGSRHGRTRLTDEQVAEIRSSSEKGRELAQRMGVSESTISYIRSGRSWKVVGCAGIEPATYAMSRRRSTAELTAPIGVNAGSVHSHIPHDLKGLQPQRPTMSRCRNIRKNKD